MQSNPREKESSPKIKKRNPFVTLFFQRNLEISHDFPKMYRTFPIFPWISAVSIDEPPQAPVPQGRDPRRRGVQRLLRALVYGIEPSVEVWDFNGGIFGF